MSEIAIEIAIDIGRLATEGYYDYQLLRLSLMNRIRDIVRRKNEGIPMDEPEGKKEVKKYGKEYNDKNLPKLIEQMLKNGKFTKSEFKQISRLLDGGLYSRKVEDSYKPIMRGWLKQEQIWYQWLAEIRGLGEVLGANLLKNIKYCETYDNVSSLWRDCGMGVTSEGKAERRRKGEKTHYNPKMKTLMWKIADSFIKQRTEPYRQIYDSEKERQLSIVYSEGHLAEKFNGYKKDAVHLSKGHAHNRAIRKMVKIFLAHYWVIGRQLKGLSTMPPYVHDKLKHKSYIPPPHIPQSLLPFNPMKPLGG